MSRLKISDLLPATDYVVEVRAKRGGEFSKWSNRFVFTTIENSVLPKTPTNVTWLPSDGYFEGEWDRVTEQVDGDPAKVVRYDVEVGNTSGTIQEVVPVVATSASRQKYKLTEQKMKGMFGELLSTVKMRVRAVTQKGNESAWSTPITASFDAPDSPTDAVVEEGMDYVKVSWTPPVDRTNVEGYRVYVSTSSSGFTTSESNRLYDGQSTNYQLNTSTYSAHYFKIVSYSKFGLESTPLTATGTPQSPFGVDTTAPETPTGLAVGVTRTGNQANANLTWAFNETTSGNEDIQAFVVKWRKAGSSEYYMDYFEKTARSGSLSLPQAFASYEFQIASVDWVANYSAFSSVVTLASSNPGPPPQTVGVTAIPSLGAIQLSWTASTHDDVIYGGYYDVEIAENSGFTTGLLSYKTANTNLSVSGLDDNTVYYYRVRAVDVEGNAGTWSTTGNVTTDGIAAPALTDGLPVSTSPAATAAGGLGAIYVSWPPVSNADPVTYEVHMSTTAGFTPTLGGATKIAQTPGTIVTLNKDTAGADLSYGTQYYFRIIATDADTNSGNAPAAGTVSSGTSPKQASSADIITITADQIATSSMSATTITLSATGAIQSGNYVANTTGFKISATEVDIQSGKVNFATLRAGTMTTTGLIIGDGGQIVVDATGSIQSNNWASLTTGWKISATGIEMNDANSKIKAAAIVGDTVSGRDITVTSGGSIHSSNYNGSSAGWSLGYNGLTVFNGTIKGSAVEANSMSSTNGAFSINSAGYATFSGALITGNTILGSSSSTTHYIQSYNYVAGTTGWKILATGDAEFNGSSITGGTFRTSSGNSRIQLRNDGSGGAIESYNSAGTKIGYINPYSGAYGSGWTIDGNVYFADPMTVSGAAGSAGLTVASGGIDVNGSTNGSFFTGGVTFFNAVAINGSVGMTSNVTINGNFNLDITNGGAQFRSGTNINFRIDAGATGAAGSGIAFENSRVIASASGYNAASPTSDNTKNFWALSVNGFGAYNNASDRREKNNIKMVDKDFAVDTVKNIKVRSFRMNNVDPDRTQYGIIAQELEKVLPSAISRVDPEKRSSTRLASYQDIWALNLAATQALIERLERAEQEIERLRSTRS